MHDVKQIPRIAASPEKDTSTVFHAIREQVGTYLVTKTIKTDVLYIISNSHLKHHGRARRFLPTILCNKKVTKAIHSRSIFHPTLSYALPLQTSTLDNQHLLARRPARGPDTLDGLDELLALNHFAEDGVLAI